MTTLHASRVAMTLLALSVGSQTLAAAPSYARLAASYPTESEPCKETDLTGQEKWQNQCAIRLSIALNGERTLKVDSATYTEPTCKHGHARGAQELANWLKADKRLGLPNTYSPKSAAKSLAGKQGIVFIKNCFTRPDGTAGDHIDLWDGVALKSVPNGLLNKGTEIWFWELK